VAARHLIDLEPQTLASNTALEVEREEAVVAGS
jgi:hypothetical protein